MILKRDFGEDVLKFVDLIYSLIMNNYIDALRKLRDCPFKLSEPPNLEKATYSIEGYDTLILSDEKAVEGNKIIVEEAYDILI